jgi:hypothetical protein
MIGLASGAQANSVRVPFILKTRGDSTSLLVMPKISKKSIQKGLASLSSLQASAQVLLKSNALNLISFQLRPI